MSCLIEHGTGRLQILDGNWGLVEAAYVITLAGTALTTAMSLTFCMRHAVRFVRPQAQRQVIRILWLPALFAGEGLLAFHFHAYSVYMELTVLIWESFALVAFMSLMLSFVGETSAEQKAMINSKNKQRMPWPFGCVRFRPSKPYFLYGLQASVLQYALLRPALSIIGIVTHTFGKLCPEIYSAVYAAAYLDATDFVSIGIALYGLIVFATLVKDSLKGRRPIAKFLSIKIVVALVFYQAVILVALVSGGAFKSAGEWSATEIAQAIKSLLTSVEMVVIMAIMGWAFRLSEHYDGHSGPRTNPFVAFGQAVLLNDFIRDGWGAIYFAYRYCRASPGTRSSVLLRGPEEPNRLDIAAAFGASENERLLSEDDSSDCDCSEYTPRICHIEDQGSTGKMQ